MDLAISLNQNSPATKGCYGGLAIRQSMARGDPLSGKRGVHREGSLPNEVITTSLSQECGSDESGGTGLAPILSLRKDLLEKRLHLAP